MTERSSRPTGQELQDMSRAELTRLGDELDDVSFVSKPSRAPRRGRRAGRWVMLWFVLSALSGIAFLVTYSVWPHEYVAPFEDGATLYQLYNPVIGFTFGFAVLALGIGLIAYLKAFFPDEVAVQQRHDGPSAELDRATAAARFAEAGEDTGFARRPLIRRTALGAAGLFGLGSAVLAVGGFVRSPWKGDELAALRFTGWKPINGETVYLRTATEVRGEISLVRPENVEPGAMITVFPFRESDRGDEELLLAAERASDTPVMLIRLRPGTRVEQRPGQQGFNYGDFYAFSKICTHLGCPASQYDSQSNISLCPCHQSEFLITQAARPVFGPATRPLPQLPITVDDEGYFVARDDFVEPVGPAFWELRTS